MKPGNLGSEAAIGFTQGSSLFRARVLGSWASGIARGCPEPILPLAENNQKVSDLVVHEWGTFLGMSGADGTALEGMYHEEHALPAFVHSRSRDQLRLPTMLLKGETPVIYFYTKDKQNVTVGVHFPRGTWTQWYPQAAEVFPKT